MAPGRILIVSTATGYGGAERSMELVAPELARRAQVWVMTGNTRHRRNLEIAARRASVRLAVWGLPSQERLRDVTASVLGVSAALLALRPDVVLTNTSLSARVASFAAGVVPSSRHRIWLYVRDFLWRDLPAILARLPRAGILVPSAAVLERVGYLAPWVEPITQRRVRIVPDMVSDLPRSAPDPSAQQAPSGGYVLHLATVNDWKGHVHLIRAAERLRAEGRGLWIRSRGVTGSAALRRDLELRIAAVGIGGSRGFELLQHAEDPSEELRGCRSVVVTSVSHSGGPETFGRSIIEAWGHGRPVVAFAAGGPRHLISHGEDGLLVPEADEQALAQALWRLHTEPGLAERLGERGREKVRRDYSLRDVAERLLAVLGETHA
jgi:glycosyltransferase involved in cell wall biosynthesis